MRGQITVCRGVEVTHFGLGTGSIQIGSGAQCDLRGDSAALLPVHALLDWDERSHAWKLSPASPEAGKATRINSLALHAPAFLQHGDLIELPDLFIRFSRVPDPPVFRGAEADEIPLRSLRSVVFGRAGENPEAEADKVILDRADAAISRRHLVVERNQDGNWTARDESQLGTLLNGQHFKEQRLTVGDRLAIGSYHFEFTGFSFRRVERLSGGKLEARNLTVRLRGGKTILQDVSLDIARCSFVGILGGSGQGKSTLLTALCGIKPATSGAVHLNGTRLDNPQRLAEAGIGYVPQDDIVHVEITVEQALRHSARLRLPAETPWPAIDTLVDETIERLGLSEHRKKRILQLSGGQRKRVSIATELLAKPSVLFLDEPSSGLDPATEFQLMRLLRRLAAKDCTVVCTTHVLARAYLFDQVCFVHGGQLVFHGEPAAAPEFFGVEHLDEIYLKLAEAEQSADDWRRQFDAQHASTAGAPDLGGLDTEGLAKSGKRRRPGSGYRRGLAVLIKRQWDVLRSDRLNLVFLLAQPLLIALLVGWVADDAVLRTFLCVVATLWFGCSNGAQQIVRELPIFQRERVCGLGTHCYMQSKGLFLGVLTTLQALVLLLVTLTVAGWMHPMEVDREEFQQVMAERLFPPLQSASPEAAAGGVEEDLFAVVTPEDAAAAAPAALDQPEAATTDHFAALMAEEQRRRDSLRVRAVVALAGFFEIAHNVMDGTTPPDEHGHSSGLSRALTVAEVFLAAVGLKLLALVCTAFVGVGIGLAISALVQNATQAVLWVPLVLIPQILFGGFVVTRPEMAHSVRLASLAIPSHAAQRIMDVANLFGQTTPRMSNRTKYAVFLTPGGDQETVEWTVAGQKLSEKYDIVSDHNNSWQNLLIFPGHAGEHRHAYQMVNRKRLYDDSVERRDDVRYPMGLLYVHLGPVGYGAGMLAVWLLACYGIVWWGLSSGQRARV